MKSTVDFYQHVSLQVNALKCFGLWFYIPYPMNSIWFWLGIVCKTIVGIIAFVIFTGGQIVYLVRLIFSGDSNIVELTGIINLICTELVAEIRYLDMFLRRDSLSKFIKELNIAEFQVSSQPEKKICERAITMSKALFVVLMFGASMDVFVHVVVVPGLQMFESLPLKMDFIFFDVNDSKYFKYVCAYQILLKPYMLVTFISLHTMPWAAMLFTISQLDILIYNFENMKELVQRTRVERNCDENEAFRLILRKLALHHSSIIRFINILQATFGRQLSVYLFVSTSVIGTTAVQFFSIQAPLSHYIEVFWVWAYLLIFVGMLFVDCYFGNSITNKCGQLSMCVYFSPWLDLDKSLKKIIIIFIAKTQQPVAITAANLVPISLATFTKVMNWTYKGFAVMNQTK